MNHLVAKFTNQSLKNMHKSNQPLGNMIKEARILSNQVDVENAKLRQTYKPLDRHIQKYQKYRVYPKTSF